MTVLVPVERERLAECERVIARGLQTFREVGTALAEIRDSRLYRETHATFEDYCRERWNLKRQRAYELMEAADVVSEISDNPPARESHAAELASLRDRPDEMRIIWREANERTEGNPTARVIREIREEREAATRSEPEIVAVNPRTGEVVAEPSAAVTEYLADDQEAKDISYVRSFLSALQAAGKLTLFDAERVGQLLDETEFRLLCLHAESITRFTEKADRARRGLRVVQGGRQ